MLGSTCGRKAERQKGRKGEREKGRSMRTSAAAQYDVTYHVWKLLFAAQCECLGAIGGAVLGARVVEHIQVEHSHHLSHLPAKGAAARGQTSNPMNGSPSSVVLVAGAGLLPLELIQLQGLGRAGHTPEDRAALDQAPT